MDKGLRRKTGPLGSIAFKLLKSFVIVFLVASGPISPSEAAAGDLSVGLRVVPKSQTGSDISSNTKLWFVVKQGDRSSRELVLKGLVNLQRVDGEPAISNELSKLDKWATFSENNFILKRNQSRVITMEISPPTDIQSESIEAYLVISASDAKSSKSSGEITEALIRNSARVAQPVFVGVGNYEDFKVDFEISDVDGIKTLRDRFIRVFIDNKGKTPISPSGQIQLKNLDFEQGTLGPFSFYSATISPDSKAYIDVPVPSNVTPGKWKIFVRASQGNVTETREFEKKLTFDNSVQVIGLAIRIIAVLIGLFLAYWSYKTISTGKKSPSSSTKQSFRTTRRKNSAHELLIAELEAKAKAAEEEVARMRKATTSGQKKSLKNMTTRPAERDVKSKARATKKVAKKSAPVKKTTTRKAAPKKKATKKAAVKRK
jgi:hypothetical protein